MSMVCKTFGHKPYWHEVTIQHVTCEIRRTTFWRFCHRCETAWDKSGTRIDFHQDYERARTPYTFLELL